MTRIGLISDTHGYLDPAVFKYFESCDEIWHAGDFGTFEVAQKLMEFKPLKGVYGNIDGQDIRKQFPKDLRMNIEGVQVFITHIGGYPGRYDPRVRKILQEEQPQLFVCGHSHILKVMKDSNLNDMLIMNPGAAGLSGFHKIKTILRFTIDDKSFKDLEVVELGKRGEQL